MTKLGKLIAVEGLEGAGKSTAIAAIVDILQQHQIDLITAREPGGTAQGELLRTILKNPEYKQTMDARTELLLMYAARVQLVEEVIKPALQKGQWVVVDRFEPSSFAYQGGGRGLDKQMIENLSKFCLQGFKPDLILFMDIDPHRGMQRAQKRGEADRFEKEAMTFFDKVHQAYYQILKPNPSVRFINANEPLDKVLSSIQMTMQQFIANNEST